MNELELREISCEIIKNKLYFACFDGQLPENNETFHSFNIDNTLIYEEYCLDFGPLNLGHTYLFCTLLQELLSDAKFEKKQIYFCCGKKVQFRNNAAVLMGAFCILVLNQSSDEAYAHFERDPVLCKQFVPYHDASYARCHYNLSVKDCLDGLYKAHILRLFNWSKFNYQEYDHFCNLENGDLNWIVEDKFLAFAGPFAQKKHIGNGYYSCTPDDYIPYFKSKNVTLVIRFNKKFYDAKDFTDNGIKHVDLFYPDGGNPPESIITDFLRITEKEISANGKIAVHCKAGLGRTGTCIGLYMMKHFKMTAKEIIGYMRIARPGSIIGPQQEFLESFEERFLYSKAVIESEVEDEKIFMENRNDLYVNVSKRIDKLSELHFEEAADIEDEIIESKLNPDTETELETEIDFEGEQFGDGILEDDNILTQGDILNMNKAKHHIRATHVV